MRAFKLIQTYKCPCSTRCVPVLWGMCGFSCSDWPSDPRLTWLKFHTHTLTTLAQHTGAQLLLSPCSEIEPTPLKNCNNTHKPPNYSLIRKLSDRYQQTTPIWIVTVFEAGDLIKRGSYQETPGHGCSRVLLLSLSWTVLCSAGCPAGAQMCQPCHAELGGRR